MALVILMRHGESGNNVQRILAGREIEFHLTERGREQVRSIAKDMKNININAVYASPITRVRETAEIVCKELSLDYTIDDRLIEIDMGKITGLHYNEAKERYDIFKKIYEDRDPILDELRMERFSNVKKRVDSILRYVADKHKNENVLLITHLDPIKAAVANILNLDGRALFNLVIPNASLTLLSHSSEYSLLALNVMDIARYKEL